MYHHVGVIPKKRFDEITSYTSGGKALLDERYTTFLKELTRGSPDVRTAIPQRLGRHASQVPSGK